ncbi:hypothetical protein LguiA_009838 [Lonicera macranthoides]
MDAQIAHIPRNANKCTDARAHMGSEQTEQEVRMLIPPNKVIEDMKCDMRRAKFGRIS